MATQFPATGIDSFSIWEDGTDYPTAAMFNNLQDSVVALETKVGINSSSNTTSLDYLKNLLYPIGTVYTNYSDSTNPGTLFGFGTWVAIEGEVIVGYKSGDADFGTPSGAAGAKTSAHTHTGPSHTHTYTSSVGVSNANAGVDGYGTGSEVADKTHYHSVYGTTAAGGTGATGSTSSSTLQPSRTCYIWRRSA